MPGFPRFLCSLIFCSVLFSVGSPQRLAAGLQQGGRGRGRYSVGGYVTTGSEGAPVADGARVDLRDDGGAVIATTSTSGNGNFLFANVGNGEYVLFASLPGFDDTTQMIEVQDGPLTQIRMELRRSRDPNAASAQPGPAAVSTRELSIPHKAHDSYEKG